MKAQAKILVVDDERGIRDLLSSELLAQSYRVDTAQDGKEALERLRREKFQLIISDVKMPRMDGLEMLDAIKRTDPDVEVILSTGYATVESAVTAMKRGAYDFIQKPFNLDEMLALVDKALEKNELRALLGIYESSRAVFSSVEMGSLLPTIVRLAARILSADEACILLADEAGRLEVAAAAGASADDRLGAVLRLGERVAGRAAQSNEPVIINGPLENDPRFKDISGLSGIRSSIVFPLALENRLLGVLCLNRTASERPFAASDLRFTTILGAQMAQAIHNARLYRELERKIQTIKTMQDQLIRVEKLAAMGQLAAGVAHEINNPLTGIMGFTEILLAGDGLTCEQREDLDCVLHQSRRCKRIVQNLLHFGRRAAPKKEVISLESILRPVLELLKHDFSKAKIAVNIEVAQDLPPVQGDASQLEQVALNLVTNARHALSGTDRPRLDIRVAAGANQAILEVADNGPGIPAENLAKIFDPFFTTKPVGEGTGLGLSLSYGIVEEHGGTISAGNREGGGAVFTVALPVAGEKK